jgi:hypothetical protein
MIKTLYLKRNERFDRPRFMLILLLTLSAINDSHLLIWCFPSRLLSFSAAFLKDLFNRRYLLI